MYQKVKLALPCTLCFFTHVFPYKSMTFISPPREVPRSDRFMKIYINHPQAICIYPVIWRLKIPSHLGGVCRQRRKNKHVT